MSVVDGRLASMAGSVNIELLFCGQRHIVEFHVIDKLPSSYAMILGVEILLQFETVIDIKANRVVSSKSNTSKLLVASKIHVPARHAMQITIPVDLLDGMVLSVRPNQQLFEQSQLSVGNCLVTVNQGAVSLRIVNFSNEEQFVFRGKTVSTAEALSADETIVPILERPSAYTWHQLVKEDKNSWNEWARFYYWDDEFQEYQEYAFAQKLLLPTWSETIPRIKGNGKMHFSLAGLSQNPEATVGGVKIVLTCG